MVDQEVEGEVEDLEDVFLPRLPFVVTCSAHPTSCFRLEDPQNDVQTVLRQNGPRGRSTRCTTLHSRGAREWGHSGGTEVYPAREVDVTERDRRTG